MTSAKWFTISFIALGINLLVSLNLDLGLTAFLYENLVFALLLRIVLYGTLIVTFVAGILAYIELALSRRPVALFQLLDAVGAAGLGWVAVNANEDFATIGWFSLLFAYVLLMHMGVSLVTSLYLRLTEKNHERETNRHLP